MFGFKPRPNLAVVSQPALALSISKRANFRGFGLSLQGYFAILAA